MTDLTEFARLVGGDHGLCVVSTLRPDHTIQSSVVNAGVLPHPVTGTPAVGLVARGGSRKLANLRARPLPTPSPPGQSPWPAAGRAGWPASGCHRGPPAPLPACR